MSAPAGRVGAQAQSARSYRPLVTLALLLPMVMLLGGVFLLPMAQLLKTSLFGPMFTLRYYQSVVDDGLFAIVLVRTLRISLITAVVAVLLGFPVASLMARLKGMPAAWVGACVVIPLWTSVLVRTYAWTVLLQRNGLLNTTLLSLGLVDQPLTIMYTDYAVVLAMAHVLLPYTILPIYTTLRTIPPELVQAAENMGAGRWDVFRHVTLPLGMPGIAAGFLMVFIVSLGYFVVPALVGGPRSMMVATLIGREVTESLNWPRAAALAGTLLAITLGLTLAFNRVLNLNRMATEVR